MNLGSELHVKVASQQNSFVPGDLPNPGFEPRSPVLGADALTSEPPRKPIVWPKVNNREGTQLHPSKENWIKDLLSMAPPIRIKPNFPLS